jgi:LysR family hydrogen peroxide-inducible transcriptional activator
MDLRQLSALVAIADHGSFSAAARSLHTVQSNVSTHVARLERELDTVLVDRSTGSLTEEGEAVVARARRVQGELEALVADVTAVNQEVSGTVRAGVIGTTGRWLVPLLLEALAARHPGIRLVVVDATTTSLLPQVAQGHLDLAVVALPVTDPDVATEPLFREDRVLVAPPDHPLASIEPVTLADLGRYPLLLEPVGTSFRDELDGFAAAAGVTLIPQAEVDGMRLLASLAHEGYGPAVLPFTAVASWRDGEWTLAGVDGLSPRSVGLAQRRRGLLSAPARAVREVLREVIAAEAQHQPGVEMTLV